MAFKKAIGFLSLIFIFMIIFSETIYCVEKPIEPVIYANSRGGFEIFWFYPGLYVDTLGNMDRPYLRKACLSLNPKDYSTFTQLKANLPVFLKSFLSYISSEEIQEHPGGRFTPIRLSIKLRNSVHSFNEIWHDTASLNPSVGTDYGQVSKPISYCSKNNLELWACQEWLSELPAPLLGVTASQNDMAQFYCNMADSHYLLEPLFEEYLVGIETLNWTNHSKSPALTPPTNLSFKIAYKPVFSDITDSILGQVDADSLYYTINLLHEGYVSVIASDDSNDIKSSYTYFSESLLPELFLTPTKGEFIFYRNETNTFSFEIANYDNTIASFKLGYDSSIISMSEDSFALIHNENRAIPFTFNPPSQDSIFSAYIIITRTGEFYPLIYFVNFKENKKLAVDESSPSSLPILFDIGQPHPNPFNGAVSFNLFNHYSEFIDFVVYNLLGQELYSESINTMEKSVINWNGRDNAGDEVPSGIYLFKFSTEETTQFRKGILLK